MDTHVLWSSVVWFGDTMVRVDKLAEGWRSMVPNVTDWVYTPFYGWLSLWADKLNVPIPGSAAHPLVFWPWGV